MEEIGLHQKNKGGRPRKAQKRNQLLAIKCTMDERRIIENKAKSISLTVSEYLRILGLTGKIDSLKVLPKEVLAFTAVINHIAANLNQIARKRNGLDELNGIERALLDRQSKELKSLSSTIKSYLK